MFKGMKNINLKPSKNVNVKSWLLDNLVTIIFIGLTLAGLMISTLPLGFFMNELVTRLFRNAFLVLSLLIPVLAGLGLNFGIVIGAMAAQIGVIIVAYFQVSGIAGLLLAVLIAIPISILFGYFTGVLYNKTRGQEMIAGLIVSFFANGIYQFLFLFVTGVVITMDKLNPIVKPNGIGLRNTITLKGAGNADIQYALDGIIKAPFFMTLLIVAVLVLALFLYKQYLSKKETDKVEKNKFIVRVVSCIAVVLFSVYGLSDPLMKNIKFPVVTGLCIVALCFGTNWLMKTKLGQDFRSVGQNQHIAEVSGINVDRTRIIATIISTVLAAIGQIIFLQNVGTFTTFAAHSQVGMFAVAALLIGGASVSNANIKQAIIGTILFHSVFIISPDAGKQLFGQAQIGEYFRTFIAYGVIGLSLGIYAWRENVNSAKRLKDARDEEDAKDTNKNDDDNVSVTTA